jgi:putative ABC transport system substrate-binding protein
VTAFRRGLAETGYSEGRNVMIEYSWSHGQYDRLPARAEEFVQRPVAVLVAIGGEPAALAAKAATSNIPIVFTVGGDPIKLGLVASYDRPGGNATGMSIVSPALEAKRLGLLHELLPKADTLGVLVNPTYPPAARQLNDLQEAARAIGVQLHVLRASTDHEIDMDSTPLPNCASPRSWLYQFREHAVASGLMSYGIDLPDVYRQVSVYAGRILKGEKPGELPVVQPTKFEFVINLKTAKALGLAIPPMLLALADEVIE